MRWILATIGCAILTAAAVYAGAVWAPASQEGGNAYRMLYAHIPLAAHTLLAFTVATAAGAVYLARRNDAADRLGGPVGAIVGAGDATEHRLHIAAGGLGGAVTAARERLAELCR